MFFIFFEKKKLSLDNIKIMIGHNCTDLLKNIVFYQKR